MNINNMFGIHEHAMLLREKRSELIASNIANSDTPRYLAQDFDIDMAIKEHFENSKTSNKAPNHTGSTSYMNEIDIISRNSMSHKIDGNTVDLHKEVAEYSENSMRYQASLNFMNAKIKGLLSAIRGE